MKRETILWWILGALALRVLWVWGRGAGYFAEGQGYAVAGWEQANFSEKVKWTLRDFFA